MTTLSDAKRAVNKFKAQFQEKLPSRTAILGDGRGSSTSNVIVPGRPDYVYARANPNDTRFFQTLNRGAVQPAVNLPVVLGFPATGEDKEEQIIGLNYGGLGDSKSSGIPVLGPHHQQHEFRGGDAIIVDSRQFIPGLVYPTDPISMRVKVASFLYFWNGWRRLDEFTTDDFTQFLPSSGYVVWVLIALDPESGLLNYNAGLPAPTSSQEVISGDFSLLPAPAGNVIPLGHIRLLSTTTAIGWTESDDNIGDARLHFGTPTYFLLDRIQQLEGYTGNDPNIATTGAAQNPVNDADRTLDGLIDVNVPAPADGEFLVYQGSTGRWVSQAGGAGGIDGLGAASQVAFWRTSTCVVGSSNLQWDNDVQLLEINAETTNVRGILSTQYSNSVHGAAFTGRKARGTSASPTQVLAGDTLFDFSGGGYREGSFGTTQFFTLEAAQDWSSLNTGTRFRIFTNALSAGVATERLRIAPDGFAGIGTSAPASRLDVSGDARIQGGLNVGTASTASAGVIRSSGMINANSGINVGTASNAGAGDVRASGRGTFEDGLNVGTASGASGGDVRFSGSIKDGISLAARVTHNVNQGVNTSSATILAFNTERFDNGSLHSVDTNNTRLTALVSGVYSIWSEVVWTGSTSGARSTRLRLNGSSYIGLGTDGPTTAGTWGQYVLSLHNLNVNDYVEVEVFQNSNAGLSILSNDAYTPEFSMVRIA